MRESLTLYEEMSEAELGEETKGEFPLDDAILDAWRKVEDLFVEAFGYCGDPHEMNRTISKSTQIDKRSIAWFTACGWLEAKDYRSIELLRFYASTINGMRPNFLKMQSLGKTISRDKKLDTPKHALMGSILTNPPLPADGVKHLEDIAIRGEKVVKKLRNIVKRLKTPEGLAEFRKATNPNNTLKQDPKQPKGPLPVSVQGQFQPIVV